VAGAVDELLQARRLGEPAEHQGERRQQQHDAKRRPEPVPADHGVLAERAADQPAGLGGEPVGPAGHDPVGERPQRAPVEPSGRGVTSGQLVDAVGHGSRS
jgi:hypothetical protein